MTHPGTDSYVSLATFRRDGREVRTPVWIAGDGPEYFIFSAGNAGKVKRIRANPRVRVASCNARGGDIGEWREATARVLSTQADVNPLATTCGPLIREECQILTFFTNSLPLQTNLL